MRNGNRVANLVDSASTLWRQGALLACLDLLECARELLNDNPNLASADTREDIGVRVGAALLRLGRLSEAHLELTTLLDASGNGYAALQLGNAQRYLGQRDDADRQLRRAFSEARLHRDGVLAIAALTGLGDLHLDSGSVREALEEYGRALGLTEFSGDERPTVAPLAGLAQCHALGGNHNKGRRLGERALSRARRSGDRVGTARAHYALAVAEEAAPSFEAAEHAALLAPHRPLWLHARCKRLADMTSEERFETAQAAHRMGLTGTYLQTQGIDRAL